MASRHCLRCIVDHRAELLSRLNVDLRGLLHVELHHCGELLVGICTYQTPSLLAVLVLEHLRCIRCAICQKVELRRAFVANGLCIADRECDSNGDSCQEG